MTERTHTARKMFEQLDAERRESLRAKREVVRLFSPALDRLEHSNGLVGDLNASLDSKLPMTSSGQIAAANMRSTVLTTMFSQEEPWYDLASPAPVQDFLGGVEQSSRARLRDQLDQLAISMQTELLSSASDPTSPTGWRPGIIQHKMDVVEQLLLVGGVLELFDERTLTFRRFPMSSYVTNRDHNGQPILHVIREWLTRDAASKLMPPELLGASTRPQGSVSDAITPSVPLFTLVWWDEENRTWWAQQEIDGHALDEPTSLGRRSPYWETVFMLPRGRNTPIGYFEMLQRTMSSLDEMHGRMLTLAALASNKRPVVDQASSVNPDDFLGEVFKPIMGASVSGGRAQDIAFVGVDSLPEMNALAGVIDALERRVAEATVNMTEAVRDTSRTTAREIQSVTLPRLSSGLGSVLVPVIEQQHRPLVAAMVRRAASLVEDGQTAGSELLRILSESPDDIRILVGAAGITRAGELDRTRSFMNDLSVMANVAQATQRIDIGQAARRLAALHAVDVDGVILTDDQVRAQRDEAQRSQEESQASQAAIDTAARAVGQIAVEQASQTGG